MGIRNAFFSICMVTRLTVTSTPPDLSRIIGQHVGVLLSWPVVRSIVLCILLAPCKVESWCNDACQTTMIPHILLVGDASLCGFRKNTRT